MHRPTLPTLSRCGLVLACLWACVAPFSSLQAQCSGPGGTVLWVSELVDANVGTAASPAGVGPRCAANTVAGAAYDSLGSPFGIQAAMDCACAGAEIRILAGANNYDSTTASWNNRIDATKTIDLPTVGNPNYKEVTKILGYVDSTTPCTANIQANCPVQLDFAGGTAMGFDKGLAGNQFGLVMQGLWIRNAATDCIGKSAGGSMSAAQVRVALRADGCGEDGLEFPGSDIMAVDWYAYDNVGRGATDVSMGGLFEFYGNGASGIQTNSGEHFGFLERILTYNNGGAGLTVQSGFSHYLGWAVFFNNVDSGWQGATGEKYVAGLTNFVGVNNGRYIVENYVTTQPNAKSLFFCMGGGNNDLGYYSPDSPPNPTYNGLSGGVNSSEVISYPDAPNFQPTAEICGLAEDCTFLYPGTDTATNDVPGAGGAEDACGGALMLIQPVRLRR